MFVEIEKLIFKLRKEVYKELAAGKDIMPKAYFFIAGSGGGLTEIIIPGAEIFFDSPAMKLLLGGYIQFKWLEYKQKGDYKLMAVMLLSDVYMVHRSTDGLNESQIREMARTIVPSRQKDRLEYITFFVHTASENKSFNYQYIREGNKIRWGEKIEDIELLGGKFKDLFPINV